MKCCLTSHLLEQVMHGFLGQLQLHEEASPPISRELLPPPTCQHNLHISVSACVVSRSGYIFREILQEGTLSWFSCRLHFLLSYLAGWVSQDYTVASLSLGERSCRGWGAINEEEVKVSISVAAGSHCLGCDIRFHLFTSALLVSHL